MNLYHTPHPHAPMEASMSTADVPVGMSQSSSSMPSIDDLLHQYEAHSVWKLISMPNLTTLCHEHKCNKCSTYLEHLLITAHMGELCAHPNRLKVWLDHAWPATMNDIHRDVSEPITKKLDVTRDLCDTRDNKIDRYRRVINNLCDQLNAEHCLQHRLKEKLAKYKGKQKEELEVTMDSPLPHKWQVVGAPLPPTLLEVYMLAAVPMEVAIPLPQKLTEGHGAHVIHDPMEDMFNWEDTSELSTDDTPDPLKRRSRKKKSQGGLADCLEPHPLDPLDVEMSPVVRQGSDTHPVFQQGTTTHPAVKQGAKQRLVASLPMSITGQLPCPLGKVVEIHAIHPLQWYDKCELTDPRFVEVAAIACNTPALNRTAKQHGVYRHHHHARWDAQPLHFAVDVDMPVNIRHWIEEWSQNPIRMPRVIRKEDQGRLNEDDLDVWLWYRGIVPKTHNSLFKRIVWCDIFLTPGRFVMLMGNHKHITPPLAQPRDCPMGRCCAWPNDTTTNAVPPERITCWLWTSAGVTADRAQHWLEPYAQCLESGQWHSRTALEAHAQVAAKPARPHKAVPGGGT